MLTGTGPVDAPGGLERGATWDRTVVDGSHAWIELRDPDERPFRLL